MKKMKRILSAAMALLLVVALSATTLAEEYNIDEGSITVSADSTGQYVTQVGGVQNELQTTETVIKQTDSSTATSNTITVTTTGDAVAEFTLREVNIESVGDAIDIGDSNAEITLEGDSKLYSESGSAIHVSSGNLAITGDGSLEAEIGDDNDSYNENAKIGSHEWEDMSGSIYITGDATVTMEETKGVAGDGAAIGSGRKGDMSGNILIDGNTNVSAFSQDDGAGIGSGWKGDMSGSIIIGGNAQVTAKSGRNGSGIGGCDFGDFTGTVVIKDNAQVTAESNNDGSGIGVGADGDFIGTVVIKDNAQVTAESNDDGAGIGVGGDGDFTGTIVIKDNAQVTAKSGDKGSGIGTGENGDFTGTVVIKDNAQVTAESSDDGSGIGAGEEGDFTGIVVIKDNAWVKATGTDGADDIGCGDEGDSGGTTVVIGQNTTVNATRGKIDNEIHIDVSTDENGAYTVTSATEGVTVGSILYNGVETLPTEPGTYTVTCVLTQGKKTYTVPVGELVIPEPEPVTTDNAQTEPLYRVTDKDDNDIGYKAEQKDGVLTITVNEKFAILTGKLWGINTLRAQGVDKIVFVMKNGTSIFTLRKLLEKGSRGEEYKLTHNGKTVTFTFGTRDIDIIDILEKE